jgi:hypothetical protein
MSYEEEEDTCHMRRRIHVICSLLTVVTTFSLSMSYEEEEDTCHMRRRIVTVVTSFSVSIPLL